MRRIGIAVRAKERRFIVEVSTWAAGSEKVGEGSSRFIHVYSGNYYRK
jgi:hypothetical protein